MRAVEIISGARDLKSEERQKMEEKQAADLLWNEWKYRHELWWSSFSRWTGVMVGLWAIPFIKPEIFDPYPYAALLFPLGALVLSFFSMWHLNAEYARLKMVRDRLDGLLGAFRPPEIPRDKAIDRISALSVGRSIIIAHGVAFVAISIVVSVLLLNRMKASQVHAASGAKSSWSAEHSVSFRFPALEPTRLVG